MKCILDCDGVIANFVGALCSRLNLSENDVFSDGRTYPLPYDLDGLLGVPVNHRLCELCTTDFWAALPVYPWAEALVAALSQTFGGNLFICTSPGILGNGFVANAIYGKEQWIYTHFPQFSMRYVMTPSKHLLACGDVILIDDSPTVCNLFEANGGRAILFPQYWNSGHHLRRSLSPFQIVSHIMNAIDLAVAG